MPLCLCVTESFKLILGYYFCKSCMYFYNIFINLFNHFDLHVVDQLSDSVFSGHVVILFMYKTVQRFLILMQLSSCREIGEK